MTGTGDDDLECLDITEMEILAHDKMNQQTRDYYNEGSDAGATLRENATAYRKYRIKPRVLRDVSLIDTSTKVFDTTCAMPFGVAPTAMQKLAHNEGELAMAGACQKHGIAMGLSSFSTTRLEDVQRVTSLIPLVLQLYLFEDRSYSQQLISRAKAAGCKAVVLTVDTPIIGRRKSEIRNQFHLPENLRIENFSTQSSRGEPVTFHTHGPNPTLEWNEVVPWLMREAAPMAVWLKGIMTSEDALLAVQHSVDGIIVSNHGGRQLDGAPATLDVLPEIASTVGGRIPVHVDGGIRHGSDIFKALALGANFCWVGRPPLWGLAYKGQAGVERCLQLLGDEFRRCMGLAGVTRVEDIGLQYLCRINRDGVLSHL